MPVLYTLSVLRPPTYLLYNTGIRAECCNILNLGWREDFPSLTIGMGPYYRLPWWPSQTDKYSHLPPGSNSFELCFYTTPFPHLLSLAERKLSRKSCIFWPFIFVSRMTFSSLYYLSAIISIAVHRFFSTFSLLLFLLVSSIQAYTFLYINSSYRPESLLENHPLPLRPPSQVLLRT